MSTLLYSKCDRPVCRAGGFIDSHDFTTCVECGSDVCRACATKPDDETMSCLCVDCAPGAMFTAEEMAEA